MNLCSQEMSELMREIMNRIWENGGNLSTGKPDFTIAEQSFKENVIWHIYFGYIS